MPAYVVVFLRFIAPSVEPRRLSQSAATSREEELALRVDAQASDLRTRVGGWLLVIGGRMVFQILRSRRGSRERSVRIAGLQ